MSEQYVLLLQGYTRTFKSYHAIQYPSQYITCNVYDPILMANISNSKSDQFTKNFQKIYLNYLNHQPNSKIFYDLTFDYYNVSTNTMESTLLDYN